MRNRQILRTHRPSMSHPFDPVQDHFGVVDTPGVCILDHPGGIVGLYRRVFLHHRGCGCLVVLNPPGNGIIHRERPQRIVSIPVNNRVCIPTGLNHGDGPGLYLGCRDPGQRAGNTGNCRNLVREFNRQFMTENAPLDIPVA